MEWNDLRDEVGTNIGVYDNPHDLTDQSWTRDALHRSRNSTGKLEWLIRKDGCMHCADPGCLKACPAPGAIVQYANGIVDFHEENCIGCGYCITGCPFNIPRLSQEGQQGLQVHALLRPGRGRPGAGLHQDLPDRGARLRLQGGHEAPRRGAHRRSEGARLRQKAGLYDPAGVGGTHVMYVLQHADRPELYNLPKDPHISPLVSLWKGVAKPLALLALGAAALGSFFHFIKVGPNEVEEEEELR